jgi:hypothetical protein
MHKACRIQKSLECASSLISHVIWLSWCVQLTLSCGISEVLSAVSEPSRCMYTARLTTPTLCTSDLLQSLQVPPTSPYPCVCTLSSSLVSTWKLRSMVLNICAQWQSIASCTWRKTWLAASTRSQDCICCLILRQSCHDCALLTSQDHRRTLSMVFYRHDVPRHILYSEHMLLLWFCQLTNS